MIHSFLFYKRMIKISWCISVCWNSVTWWTSCLASMVRKTFAADWVKKCRVLVLTVNFYHLNSFLPSKYTLFWQYIAVLHNPFYFCKKYNCPFDYSTLFNNAEIYEIAKNWNYLDRKYTLFWYFLGLRTQTTTLEMAREDFHLIIWQGSC